MVNYYHILGLSQTATQAEIKTAYRQLALRYHPDKNGGSSYAEERFKQISEAYRVLSDARRKARHDWALEYEIYQQSQAQYPVSYTGPQQTTARPAYRARPRYTPKPAFNSRQNILATAWAFGIFFVVALVVVSTFTWRSYQYEQEQALLNEQAQQEYLKAERHYVKGNFSLSLKLLSKLMTNATVASKANALQGSILHQLEEEGLRQYQHGNYSGAARLLQTLTDHVYEYRPTALAHLVASYEALQDYEGAVRAYKSVIKAEPRTIEARNRLARIYAEHYKDFDTALQYYEQASELVTDQYKTEYGNAYALTVNPGRTPDSHYQLHCGMAQVYISQGMLHQAGSALKWAVFLRPEEPLAYYLMGIMHREAKNEVAACQAWKQASEKGSEEAAQFIADYCR